MAIEYIVSGLVQGNLFENSATRSHPLNMAVHTSKGKKAIYVQAGAANISANSVCTVSPSTGRCTANTTNGLNRNYAALTAGYYGWVYAANTSFSGT